MAFARSAAAAARAKAVRSPRNWTPPDPTPFLPGGSPYRRPCRCEAWSLRAHPDARNCAGAAAQERNMPRLGNQAWPRTLLYLLRAIGRVGAVRRQLSNPVGTFWFSL